MIRNNLSSSPPPQILTLSFTSLTKGQTSIWPLPAVWGDCQAVQDPRPWVKDPVRLELHVFSATHPALRPLTKLSKCSLHREAPFPENKQQTAIWCLGLTFGGGGGVSGISPPAALARLTPLCSFSQAPHGPGLTTSYLGGLTLMPFSSPLSSQSHTFCQT